MKTFGLLPIPSGPNLGQVTRRCPGRGRLKAFTVSSLVPLYLRLFKQDRVQERTMNLDLSVIGNKAKLSRFWHEVLGA
jgi:hypothetical protein